ncbi:MAG: hypothetical protein KF730_16640 [Sphingomonas sp.]|uniref:hypothetical protein n=1 Tax=Sphingomonas sp. TaxID=28214 RepID=UPI0025D4E763|nr:hypothetical protein [Sphingomonas sp.]MBX3566189.1 hypothetical protein [Sphingomonas sp.]
MTALRIAACAILALVACGLVWALLLMAGMQAFPADSFLTYPPNVERQVRNTLSLVAIAGGISAAVWFLAGKARQPLARWGLAAALGSAMLFLLAIGADILSTSALSQWEKGVPQPFFWYEVVCVLSYTALALATVGGPLWLAGSISDGRRAARA